jgi:hypothetical protein
MINKRPDCCNKSFMSIDTTHSSLSPSKQFPSLATHGSQRFCQLWNAYFGTANNSFVEFFWISSNVSKRRPFKVDFNSGKRKSPLEPNLESGVAGVQRSFRFSPENYAQGTTSELVHCRGATPNSGSSTTEASSCMRSFDRKS